MTDGAWTPAFTSALPFRDGIYRGLSVERAREIEPFLAQYRLVRERDGYRQRASAYYAALPEVDPKDPQAATWRVRRETFRNLLRVLARFGNRSLRVLDLGAGSGWLSSRLTGLGHSCVAVDWLDDSTDGLGAVSHYPVAFTCVQADFDDLRLAPGQFEVAIFNASLHYSSDPVATLRRARAMLVPGGMIAVMDSPKFATDDGGRRMVDRQQSAFRTACDSPMRWGMGYLTESGLAQAARETGLRPTWIGSRGPLEWAIKRRLAAFRRRQPAANFGLWFGVSQSSSS